MLMKLNVRSTQRTQMIDITERVRMAVEKSGVKSGYCTIFVPHTTAAVTINEAADPDVCVDFINEINKVIPFEDGYRHIEGNSAAHIKSSIVGVSERVIIEGGKLLLGRWQGIFFCEFDGPRTREVILKIEKDQ
ncbi:secondary thiamine-phosphate synthase enzyme YjbQ [Thermovirga sp.]|uniref:secondary thiamine-phosphate synthase enzyme YjbQ n=1 Tax=Thermovirga sp. TaxID=2699834 RepID=UPI0025CC7310|nr:secondary thiamine-phosphate synthase enzyme YjbQ [Thermovirga sp.]MBO8153677.1 YjbQ family protein [Thermovirga sp.]